MGGRGWLKRGERGTRACGRAMRRVVHRMNARRSQAVRAQSRAPSPPHPVQTGRAPPPAPYKKDAHLSLRAVRAQSRAQLGGWAAVARATERCSTGARRQGAPDGARRRARVIRRRPRKESRGIGFTQLQIKISRHITSHQRHAPARVGRKQHDCSTVCKHVTARFVCESTCRTRFPAEICGSSVPRTICGLDLKATLSWICARGWNRCSPSRAGMSGLWAPALSLL